MWVFNIPQQIPDSAYVRQFPGCLLLSGKFSYSFLQSTDLRVLMVFPAPKSLGPLPIQIYPVAITQIRGKLHTFAEELWSHSVQVKNQCCGRKAPAEQLMQT